MKLSHLLLDAMPLAVGLVLLAGEFGPAAFPLAVSMVMVGAIRTVTSLSGKRRGDR